MKIKKAFTLIELLVVIAIISLLLSIIVPSLKKAKQLSHATICSSNLRQWGTIWKLYTEDHDGKFTDGHSLPDGYDSTDYPRGQWMVGIRDYMKDAKDKILLCPTASLPSENKWGGVKTSYDCGAWFSNEAIEQASYGFNLWLYDQPVTVQSRPSQNCWRKWQNVSSPSQVPLMLDSMWRGGGPMWEDSGKVQVPSFNGEFLGYPYEIMHFAMDRHLGGINGVYVDLSVERLPVKRLWKLKWHRNFDLRGYNWSTLPANHWLRSYPDK